MSKTVTVMGLGYIGLPTALLLAETGLTVRGYDVNADRVGLLRQHQLPFIEPGLEALFNRVMSKQTFIADTTLTSTDVYLIAVPTPQQAGRADLKFVISALEQVATVFQAGQTIIVESTIGPNDCRDQLIPLIERWQKNFVFAHCPERAIPGNTLHEMVHNDRIIGGKTLDDARRVARLYRRFVRGQVHTTDTTTAAMCKVMENTYRAVNIALANEFALIATQLQFNVWEAIELANKHPRVAIHQPGPGVGGHCIPIDPWFIAHVPTTHGLIPLALQINESMVEWVVDSVTRIINQRQLTSPTIAVLGYAYKPDVDDDRESPARVIVQRLRQHYQVLIHDPYVSRPEVNPNLAQVLSQADLAVIVTDHSVYKTVDFSAYPRLHGVLNTRSIALQTSASSPVIYQLGTPFK